MTDGSVFECARGQIEVNAAHPSSAKTIHTSNPFYLSEQVAAKALYSIAFAINLCLCLKASKTLLHFVHLMRICALDGLS